MITVSGEEVVKVLRKIKPKKWKYHKTQGRLDKIITKAESVIGKRQYVFD